MYFRLSKDTTGLISNKRLQGIVHPKAYKVDLKPWLDPDNQGGKCLTNPDACKDDPQLGFKMRRFWVASARMTARVKLRLKNSETY